MTEAMRTVGVSATAVKQLRLRNIADGRVYGLVPGLGMVPELVIVEAVGDLNV